MFWFKGFYRESSQVHIIKIKLFLVIWKNIEYNIGNAFDESTGTFNCPHDGIYSFYATSSIYDNYEGWVQIYVNGSRKVNHLLRNHGAGEWEFKQVSPNGVFKLSKGDTVHIYMGGIFYLASSECTRKYFQGHLIDLL